jgi:hypothetical protein
MHAVGEIRGAFPMKLTHGNTRSKIANFEQKSDRTLAKIDWKSLFFGDFGSQIAKLGTLQTKILANSDQKSLNFGDFGSKIACPDT